METKVNYAIAGIFVIGLVAAIILGIIWLSAGFSTEEDAYYNVYMKESVSGLSLDGPVEFNGVAVGTVKKMKINHADTQVVELLLKIKNDTPITMGTKAKLGMRALTGMAYILLEDKGKDMRPLQVEAGKPYPVIVTTPSTYVQLEAALVQLNTNFHQLSSSVRSLLSDTNLHSVKLILRSSQDTLQAMDRHIIPSFNQAALDFSDLMSKLSALSVDIKQNPAVLIRGEQPPPLGPGER